MRVVDYLNGGRRGREDIWEKIFNCVNRREGRQMGDWERFVEYIIERIGRQV